VAEDETAALQDWLERRFASVAAPEFAASSLIVVHADDPGLKSGAKFAAAVLQIAGGVLLMCGEPDDWSTFRLGLFGLDKLSDVDGTVTRLAEPTDHWPGSATCEPSGTVNDLYPRSSRFACCGMLLLDDGRSTDPIGG